MPNLLQRSATWFGGKLQSAGGRTITYGRHDLSFTATGTPNKVDYEVDVDPQTGLAISATFYDWTFTFSELGFDNDDSLFEAIPGDQISETLDGVDYVYEAAPPAKRKVFEWLDSAGIVVVVHTKLVKRCPTS
jgi:hypothetical protein